MHTLIIESHPDDFEFTMAGEIAKFSPHHNIDVLLLTNGGGAGSETIRLQEQRASMDYLNLKQLFTLGLPDGGLNLNLYSSMIAASINIVRQAAIDQDPYTNIYSFGPDSYTGHPDHFFSSMIARYLFENSQSITHLFEVGMSSEERLLWQPYFVPIPEINLKEYQPTDISSTLTKKQHSIALHNSQLTNGGQAQIDRLSILPPLEYYKIISKP